jgi:hypothetical protein
VRNRSPRYLPAKDYYALKIRPIYRSYPVLRRTGNHPDTASACCKRSPRLFSTLPSCTPKKIGFAPEKSFSNRRRCFSRRRRSRPSIHCCRCLSREHFRLPSRWPVYYPQEGRPGGRIKRLRGLPHASDAGQIVFSRWPGHYGASNGRGKTAGDPRKQPRFDCDSSRAGLGLVRSSLDTQQGFFESLTKEELLRQLAASRPEYSRVKEPADHIPCAYRPLSAFKT